MFKNVILKFRVPLALESNVEWFMKIWAPHLNVVTNLLIQAIRSADWRQSCLLTYKLVNKLKVWWMWTSLSGQRANLSEPWKSRDKPKTLSLYFVERVFPSNKLIFQLFSIKLNVMDYCPKFSKGFLLK